MIRVEGAGKKFNRSLRRMMLHASQDLVRDALGLRRRSSELRAGEFWALDGVSFDVAPGARLGIIGRNGSGKSTLLKLLNGILYPDRGSVRIRGRVGALIEVGAGFHPLLTGRENIFVNGAILGMSRAEVRRKFDAIVDFAEVAQFLDSPVKFYSSGMYVRLGFAVAVHAETEVLLIDEVLAVGDFAFQRKCLQRLEALAAAGKTLLLVSHSIALIERLCPEALVLDQGRLAHLGPTGEAAAAYYRTMTRSAPGEGAGSEAITHKDSGSMTLYLSRFEIVDEQLRPSRRFVCGSPVTFLLAVSAPPAERLALPRLAILVQSADTEEVVANIQTPPAFLQQAALDGELRFSCNIPSFNLAPGLYRIMVKIGGDGDHLHDVAVVSGLLEIEWSREVVENMAGRGRVYLPGQWRVIAGGGAPR